MGGSPQRISDPHPQGQTRHPRYQEQERGLREGASSTRKRHCKTQQKLYFR